jgi:serine/threonine protein kinase
MKFFFFLLLGSENNLLNLNRYSFVMEYADNGTLRKYLKKNFDNITWKDKLRMAYQLASAVSCLHNEGIVHSDLVIILNLLSVMPFYIIILTYHYV